MTTVDVDFYGGENSNCRDACIVGFCEVAMLPIPQRRYAPRIINLVVSPHHRRRGITSRMVQNVARFAKIHWSKKNYPSCIDNGMEDGTLICNELLVLYVNESNKKAISLYLKEDFKISGCDEENPHILFLEKEIMLRIIN